MKMFPFDTVPKRDSPYFLNHGTVMNVVFTNLYVYLYVYCRIYSERTETRRPCMGGHVEVMK